MITLHLNRDYATSYCTLGQLTDLVRTWQTMERPWVPSATSIGGTKGVSCIPLGDYRLTRYSSEAHQAVYAISNPLLGVYVQPGDVPVGKQGRTNVLVHPANWAHELRGCIAPGKVRARGTDNLWMIQQSRDAMNELRNVLGKSSELRLIVTSGGVK